MTKQTYDNQVLTGYLLGSLPEAETERLDELSITNDEFVETLKVAEKDLVDAYVRGELTGAELERFKLHYLASPLRREKVDFAQAFQVLAEKTAPAQVAEARQESAKRSRKTKTSGWNSALSVFTDRRLTLQWGFAAMALAFLLAGGWLALENLRLRRQMSQTQARREALGQREQELQRELEGQRSTNAKTKQELAQVTEERRRLEDELQTEQEQRRRVDRRQQPSRPDEGLVVSFVLAAQMRGIGQVPTVSIPAQADYVAMELELEPDDYPAYQVALLDLSNNHILWRTSTVKARAKGDKKTLSVRFRAGLLKPQPYLLQVSGAPESRMSEIVGDYPFRVVR